jgi:hypothetical protein
VGRREGKEKQAAWGREGKGQRLLSRSEEKGEMGWARPHWKKRRGRKAGLG